MRFFASCPRGLEAVLAAELGRLDGRDIAAVDGGVGFAGPFALVYAVNLESRYASRVLCEVGRTEYGDAEDLYAYARSLDWQQWFRVDQTLRVNLAATASPLASLAYATLRIKDGICDRFRDLCGARPSVDKAQPDVRVHAYLDQRHCTVYLDTSGEALFKRGYRRSTAAAPLRENLAAGLLALAGWTADQALLDPMCGSGTIAIEAAAMGLDIAPGMGRDFGFMKLAAFEPRTWSRALTAARERRRTDRALQLFASDRDPRAVELARANARAAGVGAAVRFRVADVLALDPPAPSGLIVTNPPYGVRLADQATLAAFYPRLGDALKQRFTGWDAFLLSADLTLPKRIGLRPTRRIPLFNGALECRLFGFRLVSGTLRGDRGRGAGEH